MVYLVVGGMYVYVRVEIGLWWGFVVGWSFVIGKIVSCVVMVMIFVVYVVFVGW